VIAATNVVIGKKPSRAYIEEIVTLFTKGIDMVILKGRGRYAGKAITIAYLVLQNRTLTQIGKPVIAWETIRPVSRVRNGRFETTGEVEIAIALNKR